MRPLARVCARRANVVSQHAPSAAASGYATGLLRFGSVAGWRTGTGSYRTPHGAATGHLRAHSVRDLGT